MDRTQTKDINEIFSKIECEIQNKQKNEIVINNRQSSSSSSSYDRSTTPHDNSVYNPISSSSTVAQSSFESSSSQPKNYLPSILYSSSLDNYRYNNNTVEDSSSLPTTESSLDHNNVIDEKIRLFRTPECSNFHLPLPSSNVSIGTTYTSRHCSPFRSGSIGSSIATKNNSNNNKNVHPPEECILSANGAKQGDIWRTEVQTFVPSSFVSKTTALSLGATGYGNSSPCAIYPPRQLIGGVLPVDATVPHGDPLFTSTRVYHRNRNPQDETTASLVSSATIDSSIDSLGGTTHSRAGINYGPSDIEPMNYTGLYNRYYAFIPSIDCKHGDKFAQIDPTLFAPNFDNSRTKAVPEYTQIHEQYRYNNNNNNNDQPSNEEINENSNATNSYLGLVDTDLFTLPLSIPVSVPVEKSNVLVSPSTTNRLLSRQNTDISNSNVSPHNDHE